MSAKLVAFAALLMLTLALCDFGASRSLDGAGTKEEMKYFNNQLSNGTDNSLLWGVYLDDPFSLVDFEAMAGAEADIAAWFIHWGNEKEFPSFYGGLAKDRNKILMIYWEAMDYNDPSLEQSRFNYDSIVAGNWDGYISGFADDAKRYGGPIILVPFGEMNDNSAPWSGTNNGNSAAKHKEAYRHVRQIFKDKDAANVKFAWAPNNADWPETEANRMENYFPGDDSVDYIGIDGFNFGGSNGDPWQTWDEVFGSALDRLAAISKKPVLICSMACAEGPDKPAWIKEGLGFRIREYPQIVGWVWFNEKKEQEWQVDSSPESLAAFKAVVAGY